MTKRAFTVELRSAPLVEDLNDVDAPFGLPVELAEIFVETLLEDRHLAGAVPSWDFALYVLELRAGVDAASVSDAIAVASAAFARAVKASTLKVDIAEASAWLEDGTEQDRQELLSGADVAKRLSVSRQRIQQLAATPRFPRAAASFGTVSVWRWGDVADWARLHERRTKAPRRRRHAPDTTVIDLMAALRSSIEKARRGDGTSSPVRKRSA
jgi:hypothetical protein